MATTDGAAPAWVPDACTLPTAQQPLRVAEFDRLFGTAVREIHRPGPTSLRLILDGDVEAKARDLAARETECCSFFDFGFTPIDDQQLQMDVTVPQAHIDVLDALAERAQGARR